MIRVYLAGPDVFETDAVTQGEALKALCTKYGFEGCFPLDNAIDGGKSPYETAGAIREANIALLKSCDVVMANLNPFRGLEPDSGTVYEVGYAAALGKPVYGYAADRRPMIKRIREAQQLSEDALFCRDGKIIEDFGLSHNLMMLDVVVAENPEACLAHMQKVATSV